MTKYKLVIAEKPSVGMAYAAVLGAKKRMDGYMEGGGWLVSWCFGHLVELAGAETYDERYAKWDRADLPIVPDPWRMKVAHTKKKQFSILKALMEREDVTEIVNGCDAGREGEAIFRYVYEQAGCKKPMKRLWLSSMEETRLWTLSRICETARSLTGFTTRRFAAPRRTGWWASTPHACFP